MQHMAPNPLPWARARREASNAPITMVITMVISATMPRTDVACGYSISASFSYTRPCRSEGWERISSPPGHVISQGLAPGARVVTRGGCGGGGVGNSLPTCVFEKIFPEGQTQTRSQKISPNNEINLCCSIKYSPKGHPRTSSCFSRFHFVVTLQKKN